MQKVTGIGGLFFRAAQTDAVRTWYREVLGVAEDGPFWVQQAGPTVLEPFDRDTAYFDRPEQQWMVNFRVDDLDAMIDQLRKRGIEVITKPEWNSEFGRYARIHDPEGNPVELWEPGAAAP